MQCIRNKDRALLYSFFRKINHLVPVTICIDPLMYGKSCQEQFLSHDSALAAVRLEITDT
jgi:hypothetical protein